MAEKKKKSGDRKIAKNSKAFHDYFVEDSYEAGIELAGTEVKSIRMGNVNLKDAFCTIKDGQMTLNGMHISPYEKGNIFNREPRRPRRLLMHKREIQRLFAKIKQDGYTLVPLPQTDEKEAVAPADDPAAEEAPEEAPAPEEAVAPEDDAAGGPNAVPDDLELLDTFLATAYCQTGTTATGTYTTVGRTLAVNPGVIPYGTHVWLYLEDGTLVGDYYAEDTGGNMLEHPYVIDIYMGTDYDTCIEWGVKRVSVYVEKDAGS